jgi:hypothetical protein
MKRLPSTCSVLLAFIFIFILSPVSEGLAQGTEPVFTDSGQVFNPGRAYYPSMLYLNGPNPFGDASGDIIGGGPDSYSTDPYYKMWFSTSGGIGFAYSADGVAWNDAGLVSGLTNPHHVQVLYDAGGFGGGGVTYKIWYWNTSFLYGDSTGPGDPPGCDPTAVPHQCSIWYAESTDGITWTNDQPVFGGDGITTPAISWQRGSYGPMTILYSAGAGNDAANPGCVTNNPAACNPMDYSYVMYYDGTTGGIEEVGLAFSTDGLTWKRWTEVTGVNQAVLQNGGAGTWDATHAAYGTILPDPVGGYQMWYSGGDGSVDHGIGYATSPDGIVWTRSTGNPIANVGSRSATAGDWNFGRNYASAVIYSATSFDGNTVPGEDCEYKMWRSGREQAGSGTYSVGYGCAAQQSPPPPPPPSPSPSPSPSRSRSSSSSSTESSATPIPEIVISAPDISISCSSAIAIIGEPIIWTTTISNPGYYPTDSSVYVRNFLPDTLDIVDVTTPQENAVIDGQEIQVYVGVVAPGETITITIETVANEQAEPGEVCNTASSDLNNTSASKACVTLFPPELPLTGGGKPQDRPVWMWEILSGIALFTGIGVFIGINRKRESRVS